MGKNWKFHLPPWRWSETGRRRSAQRHLLLPLGIQGLVHLHTLVHDTCYFNVLASRFDFEYCEECFDCRESHLLCNLPKVLTDKNALWVFSLGDFVLESLFCAQRLWILNLFSADSELWVSRFDWLKDYNFWAFQMLFISSQNPVTSARELNRLLLAIMLSLFSLS